MFGAKPSFGKLLRQKQSFRNKLSVPLEIMVEPIPDRYVLKPHQQIEIEVEYPTGHPPFEVDVYEGGLCISVAMCCTGVWIDGQPAQPDWDAPGPNAV